jgi:hypothetical protein
MPKELRDGFYPRGPWYDHLSNKPSARTWIE